MNWAAFGYWALGVLLISIVAYLELGFSVARGKRRHPSNYQGGEVADARVIAVNCTECGERYALETDVVTDDGRHHIRYREIIEAMLAHRAEHHGAPA